MIEKIYNEIINSKSIVLLTHENPDGDATGSVLAFYNYLISIDKDVDMIMSDVSPTYKYLSYIDNVINDSNKYYDLAIILDCANKDRVGVKSDILSRCKKTIGIDHHISNTFYCDLSYVVDTDPACCQIVYSLFKKWNVPITLSIGEAIISGVISDTSGFRNSNVNKDTFLLAAQLLDVGVNVQKIYNIIMCNKSMAMHQLRRIAMDRLEFFCDGKIAFSYISSEDFENVGAKLGDHEGLVEIGRNIEGVEVSIFIREDNGYRVSLRSTGDINVSAIASIFGGGGHAMAAGCKINKGFKETKDVLINETKRALLLK